MGVRFSLANQSNFLSGSEREGEGEDLIELAGKWEKKWAANVRVWREYEQFAAVSKLAERNEKKRNEREREREQKSSQKSRLSLGAVLPKIGRLSEYD